MRKFLVSTLILFNFLCKAQSVSEINKVLGISDTLSYKNEIRIYKKYSTTYNSEIFRMYNKGDDNWIAEIYYYSDKFKDVTKIDQEVFPKEKVGKLIPKNPNLIWLNLLLTNVEYLPSISSIKYKLETPYIDLEKGEYQIVKKKTLVLDGETYQIFFRSPEVKNYFTFDNPESYLKKYPNVDELQSYIQLLNITKKEFNF
jgi:hypothetical protein